MEQGKLIITIIGVAFTVIFLTIVVLTLPGNAKCKKEDEARAENILGVVLNVFNDSNHHNYPTIEYIDNEGTHKSYIFTLENSDNFYRIEKGDSIVKQSNELLFKIYRKDDVIEFQLDYDCKK